jgi:CO/xanthine dehydrogenase FAD-binding subunit
MDHDSRQGREMIIEYSRPETMEEALRLLQRQDPKSVPLGGGTSLAQSRGKTDFAVIDLQALGMRDIIEKDGALEIGANVTLQQLHDHPLLPIALRASLELEGNFNLRQAATVGGSVASGGGSAINMMLQAVDVAIIWQPGNEIITYPRFFQDFRQKKQGFISQIRIPLQERTSLEKVSRTPLSQSIFCVCGALLRQNTIRIMMVNPSSNLADTLFEGILNSDHPESKQIASLWCNQHPKVDSYTASTLPVLIDRVISTLRKEG